MKLGEYIRLKREEKFMSRLSAAKAAKISDSYLYQVEVGFYKKPAPDILRQISKGWGIDYASLMVMAGYLDGTKEFYESIDAMARKKIIAMQKISVANYMPDLSVKSIKDILDQRTNKEVYTYCYDRDVFAIQVNTPSLHPTFRENEILIISPYKKPKNYDYVLVHNFLDNKASLKRFMKISKKSLLFVALNYDKNDISVNHSTSRNQKVLGVVVESFHQFN